MVSPTNPLIHNLYGEFKMNKTELLQTATTEAVTKLSTFLGETKNFVLEQAPDIARQILAFNAARNIFIIVLTIVIIYISYKSAFKWADQTLDSGDWKPMKLISTMVGSSASLLCLIFSIQAISDLLKIYFAPKLYLIEYVVRIIK